MGGVYGGELSLVLGGGAEGLEDAVAEGTVVGQNEGVVEVIVDDVDHGGGLLVVHVLDLKGFVVILGQNDTGGLAVQHLGDGGNERQILGGDGDDSHLGGVVDRRRVLLIRGEEHGVGQDRQVSLHLAEGLALQGTQGHGGGDEGIALHEAVQRAVVVHEVGAVVVQKSADGVAQLVGTVALVDHHGGDAVLVAGDVVGGAAPRQRNGSAPEGPIHIAEAVSLVLDTVQILVHVEIRDHGDQLLVGPLVVGDHIVDLVGGASVDLVVQLLAEEEQVGGTEDVNEVVPRHDVLVAVHEAEILHEILVPVGTVKIENALVLQDIAEVALDEQLREGVDVVDHEIELVQARGGILADVRGHEVVAQIHLGKDQLNVQKLLHTDVSLKDGVADHTAAHLADALDEHVGGAHDAGRVGAGVDTELTAVVRYAVEARVGLGGLGLGHVGGVGGCGHRGVVGGLAAGGEGRDTGEEHEKGQEQAKGSLGTFCEFHGLDPFMYVFDMSFRSFAVSSPGSRRSRCRRLP